MSDLVTLDQFADELMAGRWRMIGGDPTTWPPTVYMEEIKNGEQFQTDPDLPDERGMLAGLRRPGDRQRRA